MEYDLRKLRESILGIRLPGAIVLWVALSLLALMTIPFSIFITPIVILVGSVLITMIYLVRRKLQREIAEDAARKHEEHLRLKAIEDTSRWGILAGQYRQQLDEIARRRYGSNTLWCLKHGTVKEWAQVGGTTTVKFFTVNNRTEERQAVLEDGAVIIIENPITANNQTTPKDNMDFFLGNILPGKIQEALDAGKSDWTLEAGEYPKWYEPEALANAIAKAFGVRVRVNDDTSIVLIFPEKEEAVDDGFSQIDFGFPQGGS